VPSNASGSLPEVGKAQEKIAAVDQRDMAALECGLCVRSCPEQALGLVPRFVLPAPSSVPIVLKEDEPFHCRRCGKPFGTRSGIARVATKLTAAGLRFSSPAEAARLEMCADCRVIDRFEHEVEPMTGPPRPIPRSTDDMPA